LVAAITRTSTWRGRSARQAVQTVREQFLADTRLAQQQHRQARIGHHLQLVQQLGDGLALAEDLAVLTQHGATAGCRPAHAHGAQFGLQPRHAHGRFDQGQQARQLGARRAAEGADGQRVQRQHAPALAFDVQRRTHAVVHGQRLAGPLDNQAVVGVGQATVVVEAGHAVALQDGGQPWVLAHREAPAQRIAGQAVHGRGAQVFAIGLQTQQGDGATAELRAQRRHQALVAHGHRQLGGQIGHQQRLGCHCGHCYLIRVKETIKFRGRIYLVATKPLIHHIFFRARLSRSARHRNEGAFHDSPGRTHR
jgi:hypothetical protein